MTESPDQTPAYTFCAGKTAAEMMASPHPRFVLMTDERWMEPYCSLDDGELSFRRQAVDFHTEGFWLWLRALALYRTAFSRAYTHTDDRESAETRGSLHKSEVMRLDLLGLAGGNLKLTLDAALAGYYSGSMALERHLLETWRRSAYARLHPEEIWRWFPTDIWPADVVPAANGAEARAGRMPTWPPSATEIADVIRARGDEHDRAFLPKMERGFAYLNFHAHPTLEGASQTWDAEDPARRVFGPTFSEPHCLRCLKWGLFACVILLFEVARLADQGEQWVAELGELANAIGDWGLRHPEQLPPGEDVTDNEDSSHAPEAAP